MDSTRLVVDLGSSSKKFGLFRGQTEHARSNVEKGSREANSSEVNSPSSSEVLAGSLDVTLSHNEQIDHQQWPPTDYESAAWKFTSWCIEQRLITNAEDIESIVIRIVAPGKRFAKHQLIDDAFKRALQRVRWAAPLHIDAVLVELEMLRMCFGDLPIVAASDSAFHANLPEIARRYAIPESLAQPNDFYRTGYHGLSLTSIVRQLTEEQGSMPHRTVICHLGAGVSVTALLDGKSIDTSMGMTPLEGIPMSTRVGDIDPGIILAILDGHLRGEWPVSSEVLDGTLVDTSELDSLVSSEVKRTTTVEELSRILTEESGLKALSGTTGDMKELLEKRKNGDEAAAFAIDVFCYKIRKYIGAYAAALGGLDALILTGTISERSAEIVREITEPLAWLKVTPEVIPTNELLEMAHIPHNTKVIE